MTLFQGGLPHLRQHFRPSQRPGPAGSAAEEVLWRPGDNGPPQDEANLRDVIQHLQKSLDQRQNLRQGPAQPEEHSGGHGRSGRLPRPGQISLQHLLKVWLHMK